MVAATGGFTQWLSQADIRAHALTPQQHSLLQAAFAFRTQQGTDYYSTRILGHFLLHANSGLKVAQIARLLGLSRPTASRQQQLSSKQVIQQAHHRLDGRPYGKLLPRYAGSIAQFLCTHPDATRADLIDFIDRAWGVRVSRIALYKFLKKFGLDEATRQAAAAHASPPPAAEVPATTVPLPVVPVGHPEPGSRTPPPAPPFSTAARSTRAPSC
jgi:transposase